MRPRPIPIGCRDTDRDMKVILWDFDGTLGFRDGMWSGTLIEVLQRRCPGLRATRDDIRPHIQTGFPWHTPSKPHTHLRSADEWWSALEPVFQKAFAGVGIAPDEAHSMATEVRATYLDARRWHLYEDSVPVLSSLASHGWTHRILSNHVPELSALLVCLGVRGLFEAVHTSGQTGYEKPHPNAFAAAIGSCGERSAVWMIGDSVSADVVGAHAAGVPSILVRKQSDQATHCCPDLTGVSDIIGSTQPRTQRDAEDRAR